MTKQEMNNIIKQSIQSQAVKDRDLPDDLTQTYLDWLHGKIMQAQQLMAAENATPEQQAAGQEQPAA